MNHMDEQERIAGAAAIQTIQDAGIDLRAVRDAQALPLRDGVLHLLAQLPALRLADITLLLGRSNAAAQRAVRAHLASGALCEQRLITGVNHRAVAWITTPGQPPPTPAIQSTIDAVMPMLVAALAATSQTSDRAAPAAQQHAPVPASTHHETARAEVIDSADIPTAALVLVPRVPVPPVRPVRPAHRRQRPRATLRLRWAMWRCGIVPLRPTLWQRLRGVVVGALLLVVLVGGLRWVAQQHGLQCPPPVDHVCYAFVAHP